MIAVSRLLNFAKIDILYIFMKTIFLLMLLLMPLVSYAQPKILFDTEIHDFGTVTRKDIIEYAFEFENIGDEELIINKIVPS